MQTFKGFGVISEHLLSIDFPIDQQRYFFDQHDLHIWVCQSHFNKSKERGKSNCSMKLLKILNTLGIA